MRVRASDGDNDATTDASCPEPLTPRIRLSKRDAALGASLDMYTTSLRCIARPGARRAPSCRRRLGPSAPSPTSLRTFAARTTPALNQSLESQPKGRPRDKTQPPRDIAVLGGGLTGLTAAWHLTRELPDAKITIYDKKGRMGGWIETEEVTAKAADGTEGTVRFEHAARMIKPQASASGPVPKWDDLVFFDMVRLPCGLAQALRWTAY